jgi:ferredoxin-NADP reductase
LPLLKLIAPDFLEREIFTCGPAPYMQAVRDLLDEGGFDRKPLSRGELLVRDGQRKSPRN